VNGVDRWIQPLSTYIAGEAIKRGQPVSIALLADFNDPVLGLDPGADDCVVLTRPTRHTYSIGLAMESVAVGEVLHILSSGRFTFTRANASEYWCSDFSANSNGYALYANPSTPGTLTINPVTAVTGSSKLIQIGSVSNTTANLDTLDVEIALAGDGRGPLDNTQFEFTTGESINYTSDMVPPICAICDADPINPLGPAGTVVLADQRDYRRSNIAGFLLNPPAGNIPAGTPCLFLRKGLLKISSPSLIPGTRYFLGENGQITPSAGSVVYPNALVEVGTARTSRELIVDISQPLLGVADYPLGTLRHLESGTSAYPGYLLCDNTGVHQKIDYQEFYDLFTGSNSPDPTLIVTHADDPLIPLDSFRVAVRTDSIDASFYQIAAFTPDYQPLTTIVNVLTGSGIADTSVTLDVSPFLASGVQYAGGLTIDQLLPTLYAGDPLQTIPNVSWDLAGNILTGTVSGLSGKPYVIKVYRPEALARYQAAITVLSSVNTSSGLAVNSSAVVDYLANNGVAGTLTLGNDSVGSVVKVLGDVRFGSTSGIDGLTLQSPLAMKSNAGSQTLQIDNETGVITVSSAQNYASAAGHLINKAYADLHGTNTTTAIVGSFVNGAFVSGSGVHGIMMGVGGLFDADMLDERHVGGWGWVADTTPSVTGNLPTARSGKIPELLSSGEIHLGNVINLYNAATVSGALPTASDKAVTLTVKGAANNFYLQVGAPQNTSGLFQALQVGVGPQINLIAGPAITGASTALHITNDTNITTGAFPGTYAPVKAASFQTISTIKAKRAVTPFVKSGLEIINGTEIVQYQLKTDDRVRVGFIAEWTDTLMAGKNHDENDIGTTLGVALKAIQELARDNDSLRRELKELKASLS
jgi:hypothetical protein